MARPVNCKFTPEEVEQIRQERAQGSSLRVLKDRWSCGLTAVRRICNLETYVTPTGSEQSSDA